MNRKTIKNKGKRSYLKIKRNRIYIAYLLFKVPNIQTYLSQIMSIIYLFYLDSWLGFHHKIP